MPNKNLIRIRKKLDKLDNGLKKLSTERKVVLPHHKTFELVDELRDIVQNIKNEVNSNE